MEERLHQTIGEKLYQFRKRAQISQLELELAINASSGTISRIERGQINPTKETLQKLCQTLNLNPQDTADLYGINLLDPNKEDVAAVVSSLQKYFEEPSTFAILLDNRWQVAMISKAFTETFQASEKDIARIKGRNLLELLFIPELGLSKYLSNSEEFFIYELALFRKLMEQRNKQSWYIELLSDLKKLPDFNRCWEEQKTISLTEFPSKARRIEFNMDGKNVEMIANFRQVNIDSRFELIDYYPL